MAAVSAARSALARASLTHFLRFTSMSCASMDCLFRYCLMCSLQGQHQQQVCMLDTYSTHGSHRSNTSADFLFKATSSIDLQVSMCMAC